MVVENIGGAGASLGAAAVARAQPDGYTLLLGGTLPHVNEALLKAKPLYDPVKDLDPIMRIAAGQLGSRCIRRCRRRRWRSWSRTSKANPGKVSYGHVGIGSTNHLTGELFKSLAGIPDLVQMPYRGAGPVITDLIGGQIPMGVVAVTGQSLGPASLRRLADSGGDQREPLKAAPGSSDRRAGGFPGVANEVVLRAARARRHAEADHRADRAGDARAACRRRSTSS